MRPLAGDSELVSYPLERPPVAAVGLQLAGVGKSDRAELSVPFISTYGINDTIRNGRSGSDGKRREYARFDGDRNFFVPLPVMPRAQPNYAQRIVIIFMMRVRFNVAAFFAWQPS